MKKKPYSFKLSDGGELISMARTKKEAIYKSKEWEKSNFNKNKVKLL